MWTKDNKPWIILDERFTSQKALMTRLRTIAERHNWRMPGLHPLQPRDEEFVFSFFAQHSSIEEKIGLGVKRVLVGSSKELNGYDNWCYFFERANQDKPIIDVGALSCFRTFGKFEDFSDACRTAVGARATAILNRDFGSDDEISCPETGETINKKNCFVAYCEPSMREIVRRFIETYSIDINAVMINGETKRTFQDQELAKRFFDFHGTLARMRVIGPKAFYQRMQRGCSVVPLARDSVGI